MSTLQGPSGKHKRACERIFAKPTNQISCKARRLTPRFKLETSPQAEPTEIPIRCATGCTLRGALTKRGSIFVSFWDHSGTSINPPQIPVSSTYLRECQQRQVAGGTWKFLQNPTIQTTRSWATRPDRQEEGARPCPFFGMEVMVPQHQDRGKQKQHFPPCHRSKVSKPPGSWASSAARGPCSTVPCPLLTCHARKAGTTRRWCDPSPSCMKNRSRHTTNIRRRHSPSSASHCPKENRVHQRE